jgi:ParB-like nuclease domain
MKLPIRSINRDFQPEENLDLETVEKYVSAVKNGETFPAVTVYSDGQKFWLFDGFHRIKALRTLKIKEVEADIVKGTYEDMEACWQEYLSALREELRKT